MKLAEHLHPNVKWSRLQQSDRQFGTDLSGRHDCRQIKGVARSRVTAA